MSHELWGEKPPEGPLSPSTDQQEKVDALVESLTMTGCRDQEDLIDMANVGKGLLERIDLLTRQQGPFEGWTPADDPCEIVFDLSNALDDAETLLAAEREENERLKVERDEAREVVAKVNNSFGCYAYFTDPHPADKVEEIKAYGGEQYRRATSAEALAMALRDALKRIANGLHGVRAPHRFSEAMRIAQAALSKALPETGEQDDSNDWYSGYQLEEIARQENGGDRS